MKLGIKFKKVDIAILELPEWYVEVTKFEDSNSGKGTNVLEKKALIITTDDFDMIQARMASINWHETQDSIILRKKISKSNSYLQMESGIFEDIQASILLLRSVFDILASLCDSINPEEEPFDENDFQVAYRNLLNDEQCQSSDSETIDSDSSESSENEDINEKRGRSRIGLSTGKSFFPDVIPPQDLSKGIPLVGLAIDSTITNSKNMGQGPIVGIQIGGLNDSNYAANGNAANHLYNGEVRQGRFFTQSKGENKMYKAGIVDYAHSGAVIDGNESNIKVGGNNYGRISSIGEIDDGPVTATNNKTTTTINGNNCSSGLINTFSGNIQRLIDKNNKTNIDVSGNNYGTINGLISTNKNYENNVSDSNNEMPIRKDSFYKTVSIEENFCYLGEQLSTLGFATQLPTFYNDQKINTLVNKIDEYINKIGLPLPDEIKITTAKIKNTPIESLEILQGYLKRDIKENLFYLFDLGANLAICDLIVAFNNMLFSDSQNEKILDNLEMAQAISGVLDINQLRVSLYKCNVNSELVKEILAFIHGQIKEPSEEFTLWKNIKCKLKAHLFSDKNCHNIVSSENLTKKIGDDNMKSNRESSPGMSRSGITDNNTSNETPIRNNNPPAENDSHSREIVSNRDSMKKLWITYAWKDNEDEDIDYIIQQVEEKGRGEVLVKYDRRELIPGQRIWEQIVNKISDPNECDAWSIILTENSIKSSACIEEIYLAFQQVIDRRGASFPFIGLLHDVSLNQLPDTLKAMFKTRLCIPLDTQNWEKQVIAAVKGVSPGHEISNTISPYVVTIHTREDNNHSIEIRPRVSSQRPFHIAVDYNEVQGNEIQLLYGAKGAIPDGSIALSNYSVQERQVENTRKVVYQANNPATSRLSYYLRCRHCPTQLWFGDDLNNLSTHTFHQTATVTQTQSTTTETQRLFHHPASVAQTDNIPGGVSDNHRPTMG